MTVKILFEKVEYAGRATQEKMSIVLTVRQSVLKARQFLLTRSVKIDVFQTQLTFFQSILTFCQFELTRSNRNDVLANF